MATYKKVRQFVLVDGNSSRKAAAHFAVGRNSVRKILENPIPKKRKTPINIQHPVIGKFKCLIDQYLEINKSCHYKQKLTGKRILELLKNEHGYEGSIRTVTRYIARQKFKNKEIFIPLNHPMGEAQVDFGETYVQLNKEEIKIYYFCMAMCNSNKIFVKTYFSENTLAWCDGHKDAFEFFRGIPPKITYDNSSRIVKKINKNGSRELTDKFEELQSVYLFKPNFANKGKGNEKGIVEGNIGWIRRNCFSPKPQITSIDELNKIVLECCKQRGKQKCYGKTKIIDEIFAEERSYLRPLPQYEYEVFEFKVITADKFSTIRYANTSYSVPEQYTQAKRKLGKADDNWYKLGMKNFLTSKKRDFLKASHAVEKNCRNADRIKAVLMSDMGYTFIEIGKILMLDRDSISKHVREYIADGKIKNESGGSKSKLTALQSSSIASYLEQNTYIKISDIIEYVKKEYFITYSPSGMKHWMHENKFSFKKPKVTPAKTDPEKQEVFKKYYKDLKADLGENDVLVFSDSVHPTMATKVSGGWIRTGKDKIIHSGASRTRMNITGIIDLNKMNVFQKEYKTINSETMIDFFDELQKNIYPKKTIINVILDNSGYNTSSAITEYLKKEDCKIKAHYLPPYSPNLNPIERLWKVMNKYSRNNIYFRTAKDFREAIRNFFDNTWWKISEEMRSWINDNFEIKKTEV